MIRAFRDSDLFAVMQLWLETNVQAHSFIHPCYWSGHYDPVKTALPQAETYIFESEATRRVVGFIGLTENYINGCFVKDSEQCKGIGKQLLDRLARALSFALLVVLLELLPRFASRLLGQDQLARGGRADGLLPDGLPRPTVPKRA